MHADACGKNFLVQIALCYAVRRYFIVDIAEDATLALAFQQSGSAMQQNDGAWEQWEYFQSCLKACQRDSIPGLHQIRRCHSLRN